MPSPIFCGLVAALLSPLGGLVANTATAEEKTPQLTFRQGDRIVFVGNTFTERLASFGGFETLLQSRLPDRQLSIRNLGWSADTPTLQPRPLNFGDMHTHLEEQKADVIFLCFGMNESFAGEAGLPQFEQDLQEMVETLQGRQYNGESEPRLVLVSPIPHERLGGDLPEPTEHNQQLHAYTEAMRGVAAEHDLPMIDLYTPLVGVMNDEEGEKLTFNGIHLTAYGDWVVAQVMMDELGLTKEPLRVEIDFASKSAEASGACCGPVKADDSAVSFQLSGVKLPVVPPPEGTTVHSTFVERQPELVVKNLRPGRYVLKIDGEESAAADHAEWAGGVRLTRSPVHAAAEQLRLAVIDRNEQFFFRYRAVNGEYIYGRRAEPFGVISFPPEMEKLDEMVRRRDEKIRKLAQPIETLTLELVRAGR